MESEMPETEHLRDRHPHPVEWSQAKLLAKELEYPYKGPRALVLV